MSLNRYFYIIFAVVLLSSGVGIYQLYNSKNDRKIASTNKSVKLLGKHMRPIDIRFVNSAEEIPDNPEKEFTLVAKVVLLQPNLNHLDYQWILPKGVDRIDGELSDTWASVKQGDEITAKITVTGLNRDFNQIVVLEVSSSNENDKIGNSGIFSTRPEDTEEAIAPARTKALQEYQLQNESQERELSSQE